ncbi:riboflavin biosynthesis pyrimidine reductase [Amycolatopsis arida]|nr:pyrimidine reductase family protein [Amycolatopsis arida]TDX89381.1 riboflavin biosynthesis pyrimidine reductase [Amycolatopsis arida]
MQILWPTPRDGGAPTALTALTDADLDRLYGYPEHLDRPWVQANFVASADGAVTLDGRSEGLSHPADKRIFLHGRDLADVVLVGAGTVEAEGYRGARPRPRRRELGRPEVPPIAVVSGRCTVRPDAPVVTDTRVPPIVFTTEAAPIERRKALAAAGAEVVVTGERAVDLRAMLDELGGRGLYRVDCEGGPHLFAGLLAEDLVDQLCLTVAPLAAGAGAGRIVEGLPSPEARALRLASVLHEDGFLMLRYRRDPGGSG